MNRRQFIKLASITGLTAFSAGAYGLSEAYRFQVSRHTVKLLGLQKPVRLAHLTDLHFGQVAREPLVRAWVNATMREQPEVIVITGDFVHRLPSLERLEGFAGELGRLEAPLGVWAVLGNHDYWPDRNGSSVSTAALVERLEQTRIRFLTNTGTDVRADLHLAGIDDLWEGQPDLETALEGRRDGVATVLLSHNPDVLVRVPREVGLTLSGHTHGGQVRIPGLPTLFSVSAFGERFQQGFTVADGPGETGARGFVSRGVGFGVVPIRTFCPAELVVLNLQPA